MRALPLALVLLLGLVGGAWLSPRPASAGQDDRLVRAVERIAEILSRREVRSAPRTECVCKCER